MSVALFIVPERDVDGLDTFVDGKSLAHCRPAGQREPRSSLLDDPDHTPTQVHHLDALADAAGVKRLMEFFSIDPADALSLMTEEDEEPPDIDLPPVAWFEAADGLITVRGLLNYLTAHADAAAEVDRLIEDLRGFEEVLTGLQLAGVRWHLGIDL